MLRLLSRCSWVRPHLVQQLATTIAADFFEMPFSFFELARHTESRSGWTKGQDLVTGPSYCSDQSVHRELGEAQLESWSGSFQQHQSCFFWKRHHPAVSCRNPLDEGSDSEPGRGWSLVSKMRKEKSWTCFERVCRPKGDFNHTKICFFYLEKKNLYF